LWMFITNSFSATRNTVTTHCLKHTSPYHAILTTSCACTKKWIVPQPCSSKHDTKNWPQKKLQTSPVDFDYNIESVT
jgi:hypothetical protein